ncbi:MAG: hypothetical protein U9R50_03550 [Campylobacterota bacterium]|nr:hypothetical protein [Campylobacterota bacterium]
MRYFMALFIFISTLFANEQADFIRYYQEDNYTSYQKACQIGKGLIYNKLRDEKMLSLIGLACMRADYIDMLGIIQSRLYMTKKGRANATIFSSLVVQKRLIYQFLYDDVALTSLALPISDHPLSKAFVALRDKNYTRLSAKPLKLEFKESDIRYELYIDYAKSGKVAIDIFFADGKLQEHRYR